MKEEKNKISIFFLFFSCLILVFIGVSFYRFSEKKNHLRKEIEKKTLMIDSLSLVNRLLKIENEALKTDQFYLVVNSRNGRFYLKKRDKVVYEGPCGVGLGKKKFPDEKAQLKEWDFETPLGERIVKEVIKDPYWIRPNWFWLEQGLTVPPPDSMIIIPDYLTFEEAILAYEELTPEERLLVKNVPGYLGKYKIDLGNGYFVHFGEISKEFRVSHGCIRVSKEDLEILQQVLKKGSSVFIF
ncbi:MAG: L,D-transpeptidase [Candidatus Edwardsbacteria bacterium]